MDDRFKLGKREGIDRRFYILDIAFLIFVFFKNRTHHFKSDHGRTVLTQNDIIDIVRILVAVDKQRAESLFRDIDRNDDRRVVVDVGLKSKSL